MGNKFLASFWLSAATFCLLQILFGPGGMTEMARLRQHDAQLDARLTILRQDNAELTARYQALKTSQESVRLEARALGFFRPGDIPVRTLDGNQFRLPSDEPDLSTVRHLAPPGAGSTVFFRLALPLLFLVYYSLFLLVGRMWPSSRALVPVETRPEWNLPAPLRSGLDFFRK